MVGQPHDLIEVLQFAAAALGFCGALLVFWVKMKLNERIGRAWARSLGKNGAALESILAELKPNGGNSMRDQINRMENDIRHFGEIQRAQMEASSEATLVANADGNIVWVSPAFQILCGRTEAQILGQGWLVTVTPHTRMDTLENWFLMVDSEANYAEIALELQSQNGRLFHATLETRRLRSAANETMGWLGYIKQNQGDQD